MLALASLMLECILLPGLGSQPVLALTNMGDDVDLAMGVFSTPLSVPSALGDWAFSVY